MEIKKFGKFKLLKKIAQGGMAEIFLGCTGIPKTGYRFLVIKRVMSTRSENKDFKKMFQNEGKVAININHRNVISMFEFGFDENQFFICMEYISGRNLRQLAKKLVSLKKKLSIEQSVYIINNVCLGLDYVHNCTDGETGTTLGIIHRDVSPQNVMVAFSGDIKLIDFGIVKLENADGTKSGVLKGKFEYMSPEQVRGQHLDRQTDIFSLGSVFWELLSGKKLFTGSDEMQILMKIRSCRIPDLKSLRPDIPPPLVSIVKKALHPDKKSRYRSLADMSNDLTVFLNKNYPHFTPNDFNSFIKEVYAEEILEERKTVKSFLKGLREYDKKMLIHTHSSASYTDSESTFIGSVDTTKTQEWEDEETCSSSEGTLSLVEPENSTQNKPTALTADVEQNLQASITETRFDDEVAPPTYKKIKKTAASSVSKKKPVFLSKIRQLNWRQGVKGGYKKKRRKNRFPFLVAGFVLTGLILFHFKPEIIKPLPHFVSHKVASLWNQLVDRSLNPPPSQRQVASSKDPFLKKGESPPVKSNAKSLLIQTHPSGAEVYINRKKQDGLTPFAVTVPFGERVYIEIRKKDYRPEKRTFTFSETKNRRLVISLTRRVIKNESPVIIK